MYLIFAGGPGQMYGSHGTVSASTIVSAVTTILNSNYLSGLSEYGATTHAHVAGTYISSYGLPTTFSDGSNNSDVNNLVSASINDNGGTLPEVDDTSVNGIYAVFTPPGYHLSGGGVGQHGSGNTGGLGDDDAANDLVITSDSASALIPGQNGSHLSTLSDVDSITDVFSHELVETLSDPAFPVGVVVSGFSSNNPFYQNISGGYAELCDNEAQLYIGYENGVAVQSYWSNQDKAYVIPGATTLFQSVSNHVLSVFGDTWRTANASINIGVSGAGGVEVVIDGVTTDYTPGQLNTVDVYLGSGSSSVDLTNVPAGVAVNFIEPGAGNNTFTIDDSSEFLSQCGGITFSGGVGTLTLQGATVNSVTYTATDSTTGSIVVTDSLGSCPIAYSGLTHITDVLQAADRSFTFNGGNETVNIADALGGLTTVSSTGATTVAFAAPTQTLGFFADNADTDTFNLNSLSSFHGVLTIDAGAFNGTLNLNPTYLVVSSTNFTANTIVGNANTSQPTAAYVGVGPGVHIHRTLLYSGDQDWYRFQVLRPDSLDISLGYMSAAGGLGLELHDANGTLIGANATPADHQLLQTGLLPVGTYYLHVYGLTPATNYYLLSIDPGTKPGSVSTTTVYYVNDGNTAADFYTLTAGNNANDGLTPTTPKATVQAVLAQYVLGPTSLVVVDTGMYGGNTIQITAADKGAAYAGSPGGTNFSMGFALADADYDIIDGFNFAGFGGIGISVQPSAVNDSTHNNFINNTFSGMSTAIQITNGSFDVVSGNTISGGSYGVLLSGCGNDVVNNNAITGASYAIYDSGGSEVAIYSNTLATGPYGVFVQSDTGALIYDNSVTGFTTDGIFDDSSGPVFGNQVSFSATGIYSQGTAIIYANIVHDNATGVAGYGTFGGNEWSSTNNPLLPSEMRPNDIYNNQTGVSVYGSSSVAFNKIHANVVGIDLHDTTAINHNLIYRNTAQGILVDGAHDLTIQNNTIYIPAGYSGSPDAILLRGHATNIALRDNILWADSGYDLYVNTDSQVGFTSDYNNLYTTGSGKLVWWQKDFTDLFDWQAEAAYDTHSIGYTTVSPSLDNPQFVNLAADDYQLTAVNSTGIAAGDPTSAFNLQPSPSGGRIELGAYGDTSGAALAPATFIRIDYPNFYTDWEVNVGHAIQWHAYNMTGNVRLDLYHQGVGFVSTIGTVDVGNVPGGSPNTPVNGVVSGSYGWSPAASGLVGSTANRYWIQITSVPNAAITTQSREDFSVPSAGNDYYVNDNSLSGDEWSTAIGNNRNTGKTPDDPKANLLPMLGAYQVGPGTTVHIDTGYYIEVRNAVISGNLAIGNGQGTTITGPDDGNPAHVATLDRANRNSGSTNINVNAGNFVTLEHLTLLGAQHGLWVRNGSTNFNGSYLTAANNTSDGIRVESNAFASQFDDLTFVQQWGRRRLYWNTHRQLE